ncbi:hypothetical protein QTP88_001296 [Uroleucon formosanum]
MCEREVSKVAITPLKANPRGKLVDSRQKLLIINLYKTKMLQQPTLRIKELIKIISKELGIGQRTTQSTIAEYKSEKPVRSPNKTKIRATFKEKIDDFERDAIRRKGRTIYYLYETWVNAGDCNERIWQDNTVTSHQEAFVRGLSTGAPNPTAKGKRLIVVNIGSEEGFVDGGLLVFESKKGSADYHEEMNGDVFFDWLKGVIPLLKGRGGLTRAKAEIISKTFSEIDVLTLQETRVPEEETSRLKIPGFELVSCIGHNKHGLATYINQNKSFSNIERVAGNDNATGVRIDNLKIFNVYKPPSRNWSTMVLPTCQHPVIYIGDFNSHSTDWGYSTENEDGEALSNWAALNHLKLIYGAKQGALSYPVEILGPFPRSQHLPVIVEVGISIPIIDKPFMPRWNLRKANWTEYTKYIDENINQIKPIPENYIRFIKLIKTAARKSIPRGHRSNYTPCWSKECESLLQEHERDGKEVTVNRLIRLLDEERKKRWLEKMEEMDFTHSSRESWSLLRKLGAAKETWKEHKVTPNAISNIIFKSSNIKPSKLEKRNIKHDFKEVLSSCIEKSESMENFGREEVKAALKLVKSGKAAGVDGILPDFLKFLGPKGKAWLTNLFSAVKNNNVLPKLWRETKVIAILKPGKPGNDPKSYRSIALLSVVYKLFERVLQTRIIEQIEKNLPKEQAGFRRGRSCGEQVLSMVTHIENGFQSKLKSGAVFIDLTCAYDTVWKRGLLLKLAKILKCKTSIRLIDNMLSDRKFKVHINGKESKYKYLQNGLPQGSVLSPVLFNVYTSDFVNTTSRKFMYADDVGLVAQADSFEKLEEILNENLSIIHKYFQSWHLTLNPTKTTSIAFHLNNRDANRKLNVMSQGVRIQGEDAPRYLRIKLDRTLTFKQHLEGIKNKLKTRNNIISKLAGTSWGCRANILRTSALALVYSTAEYCAPVWQRSVHTSKVDVELNNTMRIISGCVRTTKLQWLPVLSNMAPPELLRYAATIRLLQQLQNSTNLPIFNDINKAPHKRLKSRHPIWDTQNTTINQEDMWKKSWKDENVVNSSLINDPTQRVPGFELPRAIWSALNRIRTEQGKCKFLLHKWKMADSPLCECGQVQTIKHIVESCPRTKYEGGITELHKGGSEAQDWLRNLEVHL